MSQRAYASKSARLPLCHLLILFTSCSLCAAGHLNLSGSYTKWGSVAAGNLTLNYFIRLAMKLKLKHCFSNICPQHEFYLNSISALLGFFKWCHRLCTFHMILSILGVQNPAGGQTWGPLWGGKHSWWMLSPLAPKKLLNRRLVSEHSDWRGVSFSCEWTCSWPLCNKWANRRKQRQRWLLWNSSIYP